MSTVTDEILRPDLLSERSILVVTGQADAVAGASFGTSVAKVSGRIGARVRTSSPEIALAESDEIDTLVIDGADLFAAGGLGACLEGAWEATAAVVNGAFLPGGRGGRIVYLAPAPGAGEQADAARAGLENLARTLSVEWARHGITVVTIALGESTIPGEAAALTAYLASPAGAYFSGCQLDLRGV